MDAVASGRRSTTWCGRVLPAAFAGVGSKKRSVVLQVCHQRVRSRKVAHAACVVGDRCGGGEGQGRRAKRLERRQIGARATRRPTKDSNAAVGNAEEDTWARVARTNDEGLAHCASCGPDESEVFEGVNLDGRPLVAVHRG